MKEYTAKILELGTDLTFYTEIELGFGQAIKKNLQLQYDIKIVPGKEDKVRVLFNELVGKEITIRVHPDNMYKPEPVPVQIEYTKNNAMHINLIFEMIALGYVNVSSGITKRG